MSATIRDIRKKTGLSLATISKYINGGNVLPENKEKIDAAIKELNYQVNEMARGLVTNKTRSIGVMVNDISSMFCGVLLRYIGDVLKENGYSMIISDSRDDEKIESENIKFLLNKKVDGIIVIPLSNSANFLKPAYAQNVPVVLLDRSIRNCQSDCVRIDNREAALEATNILIENGHKKTAVIYSSTIYTGIERYKGFREAMQDAEIKVPVEYIKSGVHSIEHGYQSMRELLALKNRPTAVLTSNYEITLGAVMAVNESKYSCPEDISILGFDNLILSHVVQPKMTMVVQPMKEMGRKAGELILKRVNEKDESAPMEYILGTRIEKGNSIKKLRDCQK
ncbi:LacI family DNA-binding transcriptional regulator [Pseudobutyrivibrio sp.]|uniref:LacI family DNA-binding transcriptional regulator n=1 Tax=Pseudobutyrivibrio sp. TaxID=2014367 RepID=UPI001D8A3C1B|nr:LacI family DNA-binding transcriptional regulator [Pseudobutyrivibrio sp.]MBE5910075.1 LacI family transcriptional regulator [Pseudobutyrivibrio sp.]